MIDPLSILRALSALAAPALSGFAYGFTHRSRTIETRLCAAAACLCKLTSSPDWLESSKARAALVFLQPRAAARPKADVTGGNFACEGDPVPTQRDEL